MNRNKLFLVASMLVPWITLPFLGKRAIKRFTPSAIFICLFVAVESMVAHKRRWWLMYEKISKYTLAETPFIVGPFFIASLWILKMTYGKFIRYIIVNLIMDSLFVYPGMWFLKRLGIASLIKLNRGQFLSFFLTKAVLMYGFQGIVNKFQRK
jgi:hypothetical protein